MIKINNSMCVGCGLCTSLCPTLFDIVDGKAVLLENGNSIDEEALATAIANCPVSAIVREEVEEYEDDTPKKDKVKMLHFFANWCGPCKMMEPNIAVLEKEGLNIEHINVENETNKAINYGVDSIPTLIFMRDNKEVARLMGYRDIDKIRDTYNSCFE